MPQITRPEESPTVQYSLNEVRRLGLDPASVRSCAVPKDGDVKGCEFAARCIFGRVENGGFGPKSNVPGTPGEGPEFIGVYNEDKATGRAVHDHKLCTAFMAGGYDRYRQQEETGDTIIITGGPGSKVAKEFYLPADKNSNKTGDVRMVLNEVTEEVPKFREWRDGTHDTSRREQALRVREKVRQLNNQRRLEQAGLSDVVDEPTGEVVAEPVAADRKRGGRG